MKKRNNSIMRYAILLIMLSILGLLILSLYFVKNKNNDMKPVIYDKHDINITETYANNNYNENIIESNPKQNNYTQVPTEVKKIISLTIKKDIIFKRCGYSYIKSFRRF